jgi:hypothetical protein
MNPDKNTPRLLGAAFWVVVPLQISGNLDLFKEPGCNIVQPGYRNAPIAARIALFADSRRNGG